MFIRRGDVQEDDIEKLVIALGDVATTVALDRTAGIQGCDSMLAEADAAVAEACSAVATAVRGDERQDDAEMMTQAWTALVRAQDIAGRAHEVIVQCRRIRQRLAEQQAHSRLLYEQTTRRFCHGPR